MTLRAKKEHSDICGHVALSLQFGLRTALIADVLFYLLAESESFRSDCANVQADLAVSCAHLSEGSFSYDT